MDNGGFAAAPLNPGVQPIENYGVVGNLATAALVGLGGSIDFMCFPEFDSPTIFSALLHKDGGHFHLAPSAGEFKGRQNYLPETNILLTRFLGSKGIAVISDFMPIPQLGHGQCLVRRVKAVRGEIPFRMVCAPRFDYARAAHTVEAVEGGIIFQPRGKHLPTLRLRSNVRLRLVNGTALAEFKLRAEETAWFVLEKYEPSPNFPPITDDYVAAAFKQTMNFWLHWTSRSNYRGRWREMVNRSALTLKLLTSARFGSIVAAPTFGLPERIGGARNWDYRFTWIRDASFTLYGLMRLGYTEEATAFMKWLEDRCREQKPGRPLQVVYRLDGSSDLKESILRKFEGYGNSRPVRIGNRAGDQLQLDIYGELLDSVLIYDKHGQPVSYDFWMNLEKMVDWVCANWKRPDDGIWEVRGGRQKFLYSRVMCWVAVDRGIQLARRRSFPAPLVRWLKIRDQIYLDIQQHFWNRKLQSFVQYRGAKVLDAAALLLPLVKFISPVDPRWRLTMEAIKRTLVEDSLVYRYRPGEAAPDGLGGGEGTFSMCSFWYVECLARAGDLKMARFLFEKALSYSNHLGLYAEQLGPCGEHLGNFPQAFSHIALISAAWVLDQRLDRQPLSMD